MEMWDVRDIPPPLPTKDTIMQQPNPQPVMKASRKLPSDLYTADDSSTRSYTSIISKLSGYIYPSPLRLRGGCGLNRFFSFSPRAVPQTDAGRARQEAAVANAPRLGTYEIPLDGRASSRDFSRSFKPPAESNLGRSVPYHPTVPALHGEREHLEAMERERDAENKRLSRRISNRIDQAFNRDGQRMGTGFGPRGYGTAEEPQPGEGSGAMTLAERSEEELELREVPPPAPRGREQVDEVVNPETATGREEGNSESRGMISFLAESVLGDEGTNGGTGQEREIEGGTGVNASRSERNLGEPF